MPQLKLEEYVVVSSREGPRNVLGPGNNMCLGAVDSLVSSVEAIAIF